MAPKHNRFSNKLKRKAFVEDLENRLCLDGSIQVLIDDVPGLEGKTAIISGDDGANSLRIEQLGANSFQLQGRFYGATDTQINGADSYDVHGVQILLINLGANNDNIFVNGDISQGASQTVTLNGDLRVFDNSGTTNVVVEDALIRGNLRSEVNLGTSSIQIIDSRVNGNTEFHGGHFADFVGLFRSTFIDEVYANLGNADDTFWSGSKENDLEGSRFVGDLKVSTGDGPDSVRLDNSLFLSSVNVQTGHSNDSVESRNSRYVSDDNVVINTGNHRDTINLINLFLKVDGATVPGGNGVNTVFLRVRSVSDLTVLGGNDRDIIDVADSVLLGQTRIGGNNGRDQVLVTNTRIQGPSNGLRISGGGDDDRIQIDDSVIKNDTQLTGNGGDDRLGISNTRVWDGNDQKLPKVNVFGGTGVDYATLQHLIITTTSNDQTSPIRWWDNGEGDKYEATNVDLIVRTTTDVHEEIGDLLESLRRLQNLQITIEVKFITLNDNFFERIGIDFDFDINNGSGLVKFKNMNSKNGTVFGGRLKITSDLDIKFEQDSFSATVPQFGGFDSRNANNFGFAILSDIETFFLIQANVRDDRTDILQAPKVTMFNGQMASVIAGRELPN